MKRYISVFAFVLLFFNLVIAMPITAFAKTTDTDGDWNANKVILTNTSEAQIMVRVGDVDNFGYGWPSNFNPFSGNNTNPHGFPFYPNNTDPNGTDRIMVVSGYSYKTNKIKDGYTGSTSRPNNNVRPVTLSYSTHLNGKIVRNAVIQMFVDDFQPMRYDERGNIIRPNGLATGSNRYTATINGVHVPELDTIINNLNQGGPIGKLITFRIPDRFLYLVKSGSMSIKIDDARAGTTGDGYGIDFVKLLINYNKFSNSAVIRGVVKDTNGRRLKGATVTSGGVVTTTTNSNGEYELQGVPAGQAIVTASLPGYKSQSKTLATVVSGGGYNNINFSLQQIEKLKTPSFNNNPSTLTNRNVTVSIDYTSKGKNPQIKEYRIGRDGLWKAYNGQITVTENCVIQAKSKDVYTNYENTSEVGELVIDYIDKKAPAQPAITANPTTPTKEDVSVTITYPADAHTKKYKIDKGNWQIYSKKIILSQNATVYAQCFDRAGNASTVSNKVISNIDKQAPGISITSPIMVDDKVNREEEKNVTINGTTEANSNINVTILIKDKNNKQVTKSVKANSKGNYSVTGLNVSTLADGNLTIIATAVDLAGNSSECRKIIRKQCAAPEVSIKISDASGTRDSYKATSQNEKKRVDKILNPNITLKGDSFARINVKSEEVDYFKYQFINNDEKPKNLPSKGWESFDLNGETIYEEDVIKEKRGYLNQRSYDVSHMPLRSDITKWENPELVFTYPFDATTYKAATYSTTPKQYGKYENYFKNDGTKSTRWVTNTSFTKTIAINGQYKEASKFWGYIKVPKDGDYKFGAISDDGSKGYITINGDAKAFVDMFKVQPATFGSTNTTFNLKANKYYPIYLEYFNWGGGAHFEIVYSTNGSINRNSSRIPTEWFYPSKDITPGEYASTIFTGNEGIKFPSDSGDYYIAFKTGKGSTVTREGIYGPFTVNGKTSIDVSKSVYAGNTVKEGNKFKLEYTLTPGDIVATSTFKNTNGTFKDKIYLTDVKLQDEYPENIEIKTEPSDSTVVKNGQKITALINNIEYKLTRKNGKKVYSAQPFKIQYILSGKLKGTYTLSEKDKSFITFTDVNDAKRQIEVPPITLNVVKKYGPITGITRDLPNTIPASSEYNMVYEFEGEEVDYEKRKPIEIVLILNTSSTMNNKLDSLKDTARSFIGSLPVHKDIKVGVVSYSQSGQVISDLEPISNKDILKSRIDKIKCSQGSNQGDALKRAYQLMNNGIDADKHLIIMSDGSPNRSTIYKNGNYNLDLNTNGDKYKTDSSTEYVKLIAEAINNSGLNIKSHLVHFKTTDGGNERMAQEKDNSIADSLGIKKDINPNQKFYLANDMNELKKAFCVIGDTLDETLDFTKIEFDETYPAKLEIIKYPEGLTKQVIRDGRTRLYGDISSIIKMKRNSVGKYTVDGNLNIKVKFKTPGEYTFNNAQIKYAAPYEDEKNQEVKYAKGGMVTAVDSSQLSIKAVSISSNNRKNLSYAKAGDKITITIETNKTAHKPTVKISGNSASVKGNNKSWTAEYIMKNTDKEGNIEFSIDIESSIKVTYTTDGSSVIYDNTPPDATIEYNSTESTNKEIIATLLPTEEVDITNNDHYSTYFFYKNGSFTFEFEDKAGNTGTATAEVNNSDKEPPKEPRIVLKTKKGKNTIKIYYPEDAYVKQYKIGEGTKWMYYEGEITLNGGGVVVWARCYDEAGNESPTTKIGYNSKN